MTTWGGVIKTTFRLLTFRSSREELLTFSEKHLAFGLFFAWLIGVARYWDNHRVGVFQYTGLASVVYVFVLSLFLWLIIWPLRPRHWSYFRVLTFVSLVMPPAILCAIPVEHFYSIETANTLNVLLVAVVATWRVGLLLFFLRRLGQMDWLSTITATLLPLTLIVVALKVLNLKNVVFDLMGSIRGKTASDASYGFLVTLLDISILVFVPALLCYCILVFIQLMRARQSPTLGGK